MSMKDSGRRFVTAAMLFVLSAATACVGDVPETTGSPGEQAALPAESSPSSPSTVAFSPVADVQELMARIVDPAADTYWDAVGWIVDTTGTTYVHPDSDEEWETVRDAALVVAESGNLLMMEGRRLDDGPWMGMAQSMVDVGRRAIEMAEARNEQGVFDVGAEIYFACLNCHSRYVADPGN
jgi:hypothetical protein